VRLKENGYFVRRNQYGISIPFGAIKRFAITFQLFAFGISIPFGAIKRC